jgi:membrane associated rhomboid family serine protease
MGFQERDYYRGETAANPLAGSVVVKLIVVNVAVFLINVFFGQSPDPKLDNWIMNLLALEPVALEQPLQWYRLVTYGFAHDPENLAHIGFNMLGLFFFGRQLEERFGWKEFLRFYLVAILLGGLIWSARNLFLTGPLEFDLGGKIEQRWPSLLGASGGVTATVILFCLLYPRATLLMFFVIPTPAWLAGLLIVAMDMFGGGRERVAHDVHLTGAAFALAYWGLGWNFGKLPGMSALGKMARQAGKSLKPKPDLRVHDPETYYEDLDAEADAVLEKVSREGEGSLSARERRVLEAYSRRMRQKHR